MICGTSYYGIAIPEADAAEATKALVADISRIMTAVKIM